MERIRFLRDETASIEAARQGIEQRFGGCHMLEPTESSGSFFWRSRGARNDDLMLNMSTTNGYRLHLREAPLLSLVVPIRGGVRQSLGRVDLLGLEGRHGFVAMGGALRVERGPAPSELAVMTISRHDVIDRFAATLETEPDIGGPQLRRLDTSLPELASLLRLMRFAAAEPMVPTSCLASERDWDLLLQLLTAGLLRLVMVETTPAKAAEPRYLRRAEEYLRAHAADDISLEAMCRHAGRGLRSIQLAFKEHRSTTPLAYLRECRLEAARARLLAGSGDTVTAIALDSGYGHTGRFSADYRRRFGEMPLTTLQGVRRELELAG